MGDEHVDHTVDGAVTIRPLSVADAPAMVAVLGAQELYVHAGGEPPSEEQLVARYERQTVGRSPDGTEQWLNRVVLVGGTHAGFVQATRPVAGSTASVAWVVGVPWQARGVATCAAWLLLEELASLGVERVVADVHPANTASEVVAGRVGMRPTGEVVDGERRWAGSIRRGAHDEVAT